MEIKKYDFNVLFTSLSDERRKVENETVFIGIENSKAVIEQNEYLRSLQQENDVVYDQIGYTRS